MTEYGKLETASRRRNPKESANIFSILSFSWMNSILTTGNTRPLENNDLFPLLDEDKTQGLTERLEETWNEECLRHPPNLGGKKRHRLLWALVSMFPWTEHAFLLSTAMISGLCNVLQPLFLSMLLVVLMKQSEEDFWWAYVYGAGICMSSLIRVLMSHQFMYNSWMTSMRWKAATIGLIFKKVGNMSIYTIFMSCRLIKNTTKSDSSTLCLESLTIYIHVMPFWENDQAPRALATNDVYLRIICFDKDCNIIKH